MTDIKSCSLPFLILTITDAHTDRERQIERQRDRETKSQRKSESLSGLSVTDIRMISIDNVSSFIIRGSSFCWAYEFEF